MPIPDFFDCLMAEGLETTRRMVAIAESHAMVMAQHLATLEKTIEGARGYRGEQRKFAEALAALAVSTAPMHTSFVRDLPTTGNSPLGTAQDAMIRADNAVEGVTKTLREECLDRYAANGCDYQVMAFDIGLIPNTVNQWLHDARNAGDPRAAAGDLLKLTREEAEEANLRAEFRLEGTSHARLLLPPDADVGLNLADLNSATGDVQTEEGIANVPPYWIKALERLNDQSMVEGPDLITAGAFPSELALLRELRDINKKLAEAKLYILADSAHYQLCRLL